MIYYATTTRCEVAAVQAGMAVCGSQPWPHEAAQAPWVMLGSGQPQSSSVPTAEGDYPFSLGELIASPNSLYEILGFLGKGTFGQVGRLRIRIK